MQGALPTSQRDMGRALFVMHGSWRIVHSIQQCRV